MGKLLLKLFITGTTARSKQAIENLQNICENELSDQYEVEIIDVIENPKGAEEEKILATPTLIKELPPPIKRIIGDLSDKEKVLMGLDLKPCEKSTKQ